MSPDDLGRSDRDASTHDGIINFSGMTEGEADNNFYPSIVGGDAGPLTAAAEAFGLVVKPVTAQSRTARDSAGAQAAIASAVLLLPHAA